MQLIHHHTAQGGKTALLRHPVDQAIGFLNGAHHHPSVGLQHPCSTLASVVPLHLPTEKRKAGTVSHTHRQTYTHTYARMHAHNSCISTPVLLLYTAVSVHQCFWGPILFCTAMADVKMVCADPPPYRGQKQAQCHTQLQHLSKCMQLNRPCSTQEEFTMYRPTGQHVLAHAPLAYPHLPINPSTYPPTHLRTHPIHHPFCLSTWLLIGMLPRVAESHKLKLYSTVLYGPVSASTLQECRNKL